MRLSNLAKELAAAHSDDDKSIDFSAAGLYLPAVQTVFATTTSAAVSILACWLIPIGAISAVRTLALTTTAGVLVIRRPLRIGNTKGVNTIFSALRPCCFIYLMCLVLEQLVHTCVSEESTYEHGFWRRILYNTCMTIMTLAAFLRSKSPRAESDMPFLVSMIALLVVALLPPPALALSGPLCSPPTLMGAGERLLRAFLFACVYTVLVYSAAPISNNLADTVVCVARSATASAWVLGATIYSLPLAAIQVGVVLYFSFNSTGLQYEGVAHSSSDMESGVSSEFRMAPFHMNDTDASVHAGRPSPTASVVIGGEHETDIVAAAAALTRSAPPVSGIRPMVEPLNGGGLTFNLSLAKSVTNGSNGFSSTTPSEQQKKMAEIAATL
tara:strand:- start:65 stop:1216 length:1152 start_codon:yes stop_codon:yes gene_type:complete